MRGMRSHVDGPQRLLTELEAMLPPTSGHRHTITMDGTWPISLKLHVNGFQHFYELDEDVCQHSAETISCAIVTKYRERWGEPAATT